MMAAVGFLAVLWSSFSVAAVAKEPTPSQMQAWVQEMKQRSRGPFQRIRWFCNDGQVLPPEPYACREFGGGFQHGQYSAKTEAIRSAGYPIANLLVRLRPDDVLARDAGTPLLKALILENFLVGYDNGWIFRKAQFYGGAVQLENEQYFGQQILEALAGEEAWLAQRWLLLREAVRLVTHHGAFMSLNTIRDLATSLNEKDAGFDAIRAKIHGRPDAADAELVREYAAQLERPSLFDDSLAEEYERLATAIDAAYHAGGVAELLGRAVAVSRSKAMRSALENLARALSENSTRLAQFQSASQALAVIRQHLNQEPNAGTRLALLDASIDLERLAFVAGQQLLDQQNPTRHEQLSWLKASAQALYGTGFVNQSELEELRYVFTQLAPKQLPLGLYRAELNRLGLVPAWAGQRLQMHFSAAVDKFAVLEPKVRQFATDRMRGSLLLFFAELHNRLMLDANALAGVRHELFGQSVGGGLRRLNPGLARGVLYQVTGDGLPADYDPGGIYVVPETLTELPPVAGLITRSEGNALSHVQLLARNLGIPNVVVASQYLPALKKQLGTQVVMAASPAGVVQLQQNDSAWDEVFTRRRDDKPDRLVIDLDKLELEQKQILPLRSLRADHSGRVVGPKAAKLGELMQQFPGQVSAGLSIPFGLYKQLLQQPLQANGPPMYDWLRGRYQELATLKEKAPEQYQAELKQLLQTVRQWFLTVPLPDGFVQRLKLAMQAEFGEDGSYGVFVRSDTNVEDLPNFSGAGLNLTVPHVVGFEKTLQAVRRVWASPFSERAFAWRQSLMDRPEHVYASVLLHKSVAAQKSGVMVTKDIYSGSRDVITVVTNEGVGGGVAGQLAETLHIPLVEGQWRRSSTATALEQRLLLEHGGSSLVATEWPGQPLLNQAEVEQLKQLAISIPRRMAEFASPEVGGAAVADVEFGFADGQLWLFQIRPLVESKRANRNRLLNSLDEALTASSEFEIDMQRPLLLGVNHD